MYSSTRDWTSFFNRDWPSPIFCDWTTDEKYFAQMTTTRADATVHGIARGTCILDAACTSNSLQRSFKHRID